MDLLESLKGTYAVLGQDMTDLGLEMLAHDLEPYPLTIVQSALSRCRKELKRMALADILDRLPGGHPGPEEAWATIASAMADESRTLVWTDEMREAYGVASAISDDPVASRMAFKESYQRAVSESRAAGRVPNWSVSLGSNKSGRELAIMEGVKAGKLSLEYAQRVLPKETIESSEAAKLLEQHFPKLLQ